MTLENLLSGENLTLLLLAAGCCVLGVVVFFVMQFVGGILDVVSGVLGLITGVIGGGPVAWCGCLLAMGGLCACALMVYVQLSVLPNCGGANAINLCRLFGY